MSDTVVSFASSFAVGLLALFVVLKRFSGFASANPNDRTNHKRPTPQVGGLALMPVFLLAMIAFRFLGRPLPVFSHLGFLAAVLVLFATGIIDDRKALGPLPKLAAQFLAAGLAVTALSDILSSDRFPYVLSVVVAFFMLVAITNLANFLDGLDLMAVATIGVPSFFFACLAGSGLIAAAFGPAGAVLAGLFLAFVFYNRPPARAFLGDAGSLPFGLTLGTMTIIVACEISPVAALLLPAYMLCDGLVTIVRRTLKGENILHAHSAHVYQRAFRAGRPLLLVIAAAAALGSIAGLTLLTTAHTGIGWQVVAVVVVFSLWWLISARLVRDPRA